MLSSEGDPCVTISSIGPVSMAPDVVTTSIRKTLELRLEVTGLAFEDLKGYTLLWYLDDFLGGMLRWQ